MPGEHSEREKRMAQHIIESEMAKGKSEEEATRIAWATVNSMRNMRKGKLESFKGLGK